MKTYMKWLLAVMGALAALSVFVVALLGSIHGAAQDRDFYAREYAELGTAEDTGLSEADLNRVTDALLVYLSDGNSDSVAEMLTLHAEVHGMSRQVFNEREISHMADVRVLYRQGLGVCFAFAGVLVLAAFFVIFYLWRFTVGSRKEVLRHVLRGFWMGNGLVVAVICGLVLWASLDFSGFFVALHETLFSNDLWLLDPRQDILIQIMQEQVFFDMAMRAIIGMSLIWAGVSCGAGVGLFCLRRKRGDSDA